MMSLTHVQFQQVNLNDVFFDSLKQDYAEFEGWFAKKATNMAYLSNNESGDIDGFLYLKVEEDALSDVIPALPPMRRLKVGTFKIDAHGTKLGDRFIKKIFDVAMAEHVEGLYVTIFEKHEPLLNLLQKYGFEKHGTKTTMNGTEFVLTRGLVWQAGGLQKNFPLVRPDGVRKVLLAIYPQWHTRLFPDSKLANEGPDVVEDISHTNSIQKVYLAGRSGAQTLKHGDLIVIYRTSDEKAPARYRSVATSLCVVEKVQGIATFSTEEEFLRYCNKFSVFTDDELRDLYSSKKYPVVITFMYNVSFPKRVTRKVLLEEVGLDANARWSCLDLSDQQFAKILERGDVDAHFVVN